MRRSASGVGYEGEQRFQQRVGHENPMIYDWGCHGKEPTIKSQVFNVDAQDYRAELWQTVTH